MCMLTGSLSQFSRLVTGCTKVNISSKINALAGELMQQEIEHLVSVRSQLEALGSAAQCSEISLGQAPSIVSRLPEDEMYSLVACYTQLFILMLSSFFADSAFKLAVAGSLGASDVAFDSSYDDVSFLACKLPPLFELQDFCEMSVTDTHHQGLALPVITW